MNYELFQDPPCYLMDQSLKGDDKYRLIEQFKRQRVYFTEAKLLCSVKAKGEDSKRNREELNAGKKFIYRDQTVSVTDQFLQFAYKISDQLNVDEYLACGLFKTTLDTIDSAVAFENEKKFFEQIERILYERRSIYLISLRDLIKMTKFQVIFQEELEGYVRDLIESGVVDTLLAIFTEKLKDINLPVNPVEWEYRITEIHAINDILLLLSKSFHLKPENLKSIFQNLRNTSKLLTILQKNTLLYSHAFKITFYLVFTLFNILFDRSHKNGDEPSTDYYRSLEDSYRSELAADGWSHAVFIQSTLRAYLNMVDYRNTSPLPTTEITNNLFKQSNAYFDYPISVLESLEFKKIEDDDYKGQMNYMIDQLLGLFSSFVVRATSADQKEYSVVSGFLKLGSLLYKNYDSTSFYRSLNDSSSLNFLMVQLKGDQKRDNRFIISVLQFLGSLAISNPRSIHNYLGSEYPQFSVPQIIHYLSHYGDKVNENGYLQEEDSLILVEFLVLLRNLFSSSKEIASNYRNDVFAALTKILKFSDPTFKKTAISVLVAFSKYPDYDFQKSVWDAAKGENLFTMSYNDIGTLPEQYIEILQVFRNILVAKQPDIPSTDSSKAIADHLIKMFNSLNSKMFDQVEDKLALYLELLGIFGIYLEGLQKASALKSGLDDKHPGYPIYKEIITDQKTLKTILFLLSFCYHQEKKITDRILEKSLDILLELADLHLFPYEENILVTIPTMRSQPILSIATLVNHPITEVSLKAIRFLLAFEVFNKKCASFFLKSPQPNEILQRFVQILSFKTDEHENLGSNDLFQQEIDFIYFNQHSPKMTITNLIEDSLKSSDNPKDYTLGHFLLGIPLTFDTNADATLVQPSCLNTMLAESQEFESLKNCPHLLEKYHQIIYRMISDPYASKSIIKVVSIEYYQNSLSNIQTILREYDINDRIRLSLLNSFKFILKSLSVTIKCNESVKSTINVDLSTFVENLFQFNNQGSTLLIDQLNELNLINLFNLIDLTSVSKRFDEPQLQTNQDLQSYLNQGLYDTVRLFELRQSPQNQFSEQDYDNCMLHNYRLRLKSSRIESLEAWRTLLEISITSYYDPPSTIPTSSFLVVLSKLIGEFSNDNYDQIISYNIGQSLVFLIFLINARKDSGFFETNSSVEQKIYEIYENLILTVLKSPFQTIRGISYTCLINHLLLMSNCSPGLTSRMNSLIDDKFIKILLSDCYNSSNGWKMVSSACLQSILDQPSVNRIVEKTNIISNIVNDICSKYLEKWESIDDDSIKIFNSQISLLLKITLANNLNLIIYFINNDCVSVFARSTLLKYSPTSTENQDKFYRLAIPILKLFCSLIQQFTVEQSIEKSKLLRQIFDFIISKGDLFLGILQNTLDKEVISSTRLTVLEHITYLFSSISILAKDKENSNQFNRFHHPLLNLLQKYLKSKSDLVKLAKPEDQDEFLLSQKYDLTYPNVDSIKSKKSLFQIQIRDKITLVIRNLFSYCLGMSLPIDSQLRTCQSFGFLCFNSKLTNLDLNSESYNSRQHSSSHLPNFELIFFSLIDNLLQYHNLIQHIEGIKNNFSEQKLNDFQITKLKELFENLPHDCYLDFEEYTPTQRNNLILSKMSEKSKLLTLKSDILFENIEMIIVIVLSHSYYYTSNIQNLFKYQKNLQSPDEFNQSPMILNNNGNANQLQLSDLNNNQSKSSKPLLLPPSKSNNLLNSVMSYFKPTSSSGPLKNNSLNNNNNFNSSQFNQSTFSTSLNSTARDYSNDTNSPLSSDESFQLQDQLRNLLFSKDIQVLGGNIYTVLVNINKSKNSTLLDISLKKLQELLQK